MYFDQIDLSGVTASEGGRMLGEGRHNVKILEASFGPNQQKTGYKVEVKFGNDQGTIRTIYNIKNASPDAQRIGMEQFKALLVNAGHPNPDKPGDINSLKGLFVGIYVQKDGTYQDKNGNTRDNFAVKGTHKPDGAVSSNPMADLTDDIPF